MLKVAIDKVKTNFNLLTLDYLLHLNFNLLFPKSLEVATAIPR